MRDSVMDDMEKIPYKTGLKVKIMIRKHEKQDKFF
jgi:hypothetical protein